jgi:single-strand DNA-binding protein
LKGEKEMLNKVVLIGRLCADPDLRYTQSGTAVASFRLAVNRNFTNSQGEREADFIPIQVWRNAAENCAKYLAKGRLVAVSGRIQTRSYDGPDGQRRYTWEVVADEVQFIDWGEKKETDTPGFENVDVPDDELPF